MSAVLRRIVPKPLRPPLRKAWEKLNHRYYARKIFGRNAEFIPPPSLMHDGPVGYREFKENGEEFFRHYVELCSLRRDERMLDLGCGIGRKTLQLVDYLSENGSYEGMDIVKSGIDWCTEKYTSRHPNFRFQLIDVYNQLYNPAGKYKASEYKFPFPDMYFDFAVLNSVFTHMMPEEMENYLSEVARVLKRGGRCFTSFFLLNHESSSQIKEGRSTLDLRYDYGPARAVSRETPELALGYDERYIADLYEKCGLDIRTPILYGSWCGRKDYLSYQDQILAFNREEA